MRAKSLLGVTVVLGLVLLSTQAMALDVQQVFVSYMEGRTDDTANEWAFQAFITGTGITDIVFQDQNSLYQGGIPYDPVRGGWFYRDDSYASRSAFDTDHPNPTSIKFWFNYISPGVYTDLLTATYNTTEPTGFADITYPAHNQTGVGVNPTYTWDNVDGMGDTIFLSVEDDGGSNVYYHGPDADMTMMSWSPVPSLGESTKYWFEVTLNKTSSAALTTWLGDPVSYYGYNTDSNEVGFTTIPEPASLALVGTGVLTLVGLMRRRFMS